MTSTHSHPGVGIENCLLLARRSKRVTEDGGPQQVEQSNKRRARSASSMVEGPPAYSSVFDVSATTGPAGTRSFDICSVGTDLVAGTASLDPADSGLVKSVGNPVDTETSRLQVAFLQTLKWEEVLQEFWRVSSADRNAVYVMQTDSGRSLSISAQLHFPCLGDSQLRLRLGTKHSIIRESQQVTERSIRAIL